MTDNAQYNTPAVLADCFNGIGVALPFYLIYAIKKSLAPCNVYNWETREKIQNSASVNHVINIKIKKIDISDVGDMTACVCVSCSSVAYVLKNGHMIH